MIDQSPAHCEPLQARRLQRPLITGAAVILFLLGSWAILKAAYIPVKAAVAQMLLSQAWAETVAMDGEKISKPWPWADMWPIAKIEVPRLKQSAIVLQGATGQSMAFGPGHMSNTAPIGTNGTAVIAAHRDTHFSFLKRLSIGDEIKTVLSDGTELNYEVIGTKIVLAIASGIDPYVAGPTGSRMVLATCYPFEAITPGPLRYVVIADKVPTGMASLSEMPQVN